MELKFIVLGALLGNSKAAINGQRNKSWPAWDANNSKLTRADPTTVAGEWGSTGVACMRFGSYLMPT